jgi:hypothetical protein
VRKERDNNARAENRRAAPLAHVDQEGDLHEGREQERQRQHAAPALARRRSRRKSAYLK